jgi:hypothetical protein
MTVAELISGDEGEATAVLEWRFSQLRKSGYGIEDAVVIAASTDVDLHYAADLVVRGCPPPLAVQILL